MMPSTSLIIPFAQPRSTPSYVTLGNNLQCIMCPETTAQGFYSMPPPSIRRPPRPPPAAHPRRYPSRPSMVRLRSLPRPRPRRRPLSHQRRSASLPRPQVQPALPLLLSLTEQRGPSQPVVLTRSQQRSRALLLLAASRTF